MTKKAKATPKVGRESDKFMLRLPPGMRDAISRDAAKQGRSMNAEIVDRLARSFDGSKDSDEITRRLDRLEDSAAALKKMFLDFGGNDLDDFIAERREKGELLSRDDAIRLIVRGYLAERGYVRNERASKKG